jgi:cell division protein FtsL
VLGPRVGSRAGRNAVRRRRGRRTLSRYLLLARIVVTVSVLTIAIGIYLALMANVTRMNYELTKNARAEARLADESARLEDEIAHLGSRERLAGIAAKLGMRDSQTFAQVSLPAPGSAAKPTGIAFLPWLK